MLQERLALQEAEACEDERNEEDVLSNFGEDSGDEGNHKAPKGKAPTREEMLLSRLRKVRGVGITLPRLQIKAAGSGGNGAGAAGSVGGGGSAGGAGAGNGSAGGAGGTGSAGVALSLSQSEQRRVAAALLRQQARLRVPDPLPLVRAERRGVLLQQRVARVLLPPVLRPGGLVPLDAARVDRPGRRR